MKIKGRKPAKSSLPGLVGDVGELANPFETNRFNANHEAPELLSLKFVELASGYATIHGKQDYFVDRLELMAADVTQVFGRMWKGLQRSA